MATEEKRANLKTLIHKLMNQPKNLRYTSNGHTVRYAHTNTLVGVMHVKGIRMRSATHTINNTTGVNKSCLFDGFNRIEPLEIQYFRQLNDHFMGSNLLNGVSFATQKIEMIPKINFGHTT